MIDKWDKRFMALADHVSMWSKDPSTQVGAVIVDDTRRHVHIGYNGFPRGIEDDHRLDIRDLKYPRTLHAEENAISNARCSLEGYTLYVSPLKPCSHCAALIIQAGIKRVVCLKTQNKRWDESCEIGLEMFAEAGIKVDMLDL